MDEDQGQQISPSCSTNSWHDSTSHALRMHLRHDGVFAPVSVLYFVLNGEPEAASQAAENFLDDIAGSGASCITLTGGLGHIVTLIEEPFSMTHSAMPDELKCSIGMTPGGISLSTGLEDWQDVIEELSAALDRLQERVRLSNSER